MNVFLALLLGLVQGLTEFLPISSSAHLQFLKIVFHIENGQDSPLFDLSCHMGTTMALLWYFRKEIYHLFVENRKELLFFFLALVPLLPAYFCLQVVREALSAPHLLGLFLLVTSLILFVVHKKFPSEVALPSKDPTPPTGGKGVLSKWLVQIRRKAYEAAVEEEKADTPKENLAAYAKEAFYIGTMQAIALIPGISRSGVTIATARVLGWSFQRAVRFSFLLSVPAIVGGTCIESWKLLQIEPFSLSSLPIFLAGFSTSFLSGFAIIAWAIPFLEKGKLLPFAWYCLLAGLLMSLYLFRVFI